MHVYTMDRYGYVFLDHGEPDYVTVVAVYSRICGPQEIHAALERENFDLLRTAFTEDWVEVSQ